MLIQIIILVTGCTSIWVVNRKEKWYKYGCIIGLLGQPAWLYLAITTHNWEIFILTLVYTYSWGQGVYFNFIKKYIKRILVKKRKLENKVIDKLNEWIDE
jgi:hypothetical protein